VTIARSGNPEHALRSLAVRRAESYAYHPQRLVRDIATLRRNFARLTALLRGHAGRQWGRREARVPSRNEYVKYTQNFKSRAMVNFDRGLVTVETLDTAHPERSLDQAIVTTLLTPDDPRAVDLYSAAPIRLAGRPYLYGLVLDQNRRPIGTPREAEDYARHLVRTKRTRIITTPRGTRRVAWVQFKMVSDHTQQSARRYAPLVAEYARRYKISKSLIYGIIKTESSFNPFAVSAAPAFGLMQIVPTSAGRDAYRLLYGKDGVPGRAYLFNPRNNIEMGVAYLSLLKYRYLAAIRNPVSREYCFIAAYNGGAGNVLTTFSRDRAQAVKRINRLSPAQVYHRLRTDHPQAETRRYLWKVLAARKEFIHA
jgi:membrane-bound lytic murein transglycosylase C